MPRPLTQSVGQPSLRDLLAEQGKEGAAPFIFPEWTVTMQASTKTGRKIFTQSGEAMESVNGILNLATELTSPDKKNLARPNS